VSAGARTPPRPRPALERWTRGRAKLLLTAYAWRCPMEYAGRGGRRGLSTRRGGFLALVEEAEGQSSKSLAVFGDAAAPHRCVETRPWEAARHGSRAAAPRSSFGSPTQGCMPFRSRLLPLRQALGVKRGTRKGARSARRPVPADALCANRRKAGARRGGSMHGGTGPADRGRRTYPVDSRNSLGTADGRRTKPGRSRADARISRADTPPDTGRQPGDSDEATGTRLRTGGASARQREFRRRPPRHVITATRRSTGLTCSFCTPTAAAPVWSPTTPSRPSRTPIWLSSARRSRSGPAPVTVRSRVEPDVRPVAGAAGARPGARRVRRHLHGTDRFHLLGDALEWRSVRPAPTRCGWAADSAGGPVLDAFLDGAVVAVLGTALARRAQGGGLAVPLRGPDAEGPLTALLARNRDDGARVGADLESAGVLEMTATPWARTGRGLLRARTTMTPGPSNGRMP